MPVSLAGIKGPVKGAVYVLLALPVSLVFLLLLMCLALVKLLLPVAPLQRGCTHLVIAIAEQWAHVCGLLYEWVHAPKWDVRGLDDLHRDQWYMLICNHQSWSDIPVLVFLMNRKIPVFRFFVKQQLLWVPVVGLACWAMEFPFMKRYSKQQLQRNPRLRSKDAEATRQFCSKLKDRPATIVNYLEGTRFTPLKHARQNSRYRHLLNPKSGGIAYVTTHLGDRIDQLLDITLIYPGRRIGFWAFLCGELGPVVVDMQSRAIPEHLKQGDYQQSDAFRLAFQQWIAQLWQDKDELIDRERRRLKHPL